MNDIPFALRGKRPAATAAFATLAMSVITVTSILAGQAEQSSSQTAQPGGTQQVPPPREPEIAEASDEGARAMRRFQLAEGLDVSLYAAEPLVANPVAFCFDEFGRCYVAETFRQERGVEDNRNHMNWLDDEIAAETVEERVAVFRKYLGEDVNNYMLHDDRIRLLRDTDGDGIADDASVFANRFNDIADGTGAGVLAHNGDLYYTCIPKLWLLRDEDDDRVADERVALQDGYGVHVAFRGHDMHGLTLGPDGRLYFSIGDRGFNVDTPEGKVAQPHTGAVLRCNLDGTGLEVFAYGMRNPQELAFDDYGNLFTGDNNSDSGDRARWVYVMPGGDSGWRMSFQYFNDRGPWNREQLWDPPFPEQASNIVPPLANLGDGPSGLAYYPGTGLGDEYLDTFFLCDFRGASGSSGVRTIKMKPKGAGFEIENDDQLIWRVLATDIEFGPGGGVYISDWVDGWTGVGKGRIYKVSNPELAESEIVAEVDRLLAEDFVAKPVGDVAFLLRHPDRRVRLKAQYELASRDPQEALWIFGAVAQFGLPDLAPGGGLPDIARGRLAARIARVHGIWGLGQLARRPEASEGRGEIAFELALLLENDDVEVRANAARALADCANVMRDANLPRVVAALIERLSDSSLRVQSLAAIALGKYGDGETVEPLLALLNRNADADPYLRHAAVMGLVGCGADALVHAASDGANLSVSQRRGLLLALRRLRDPRVAMYLNDPDPGIVTDAARAINDEPIDEAMTELAALASQPGLPDPALRRAINACLRLRTAAHAAAVAKLAGNPSVTPEVQREAIEALREWPGELQRGRVIGLWRDQLFETPPSIAEVAEVVRPQLAGMLAGDRRMRRSVTGLIAELEIGSAGDMLIEMFEDSTRDGETRASTISALFAIRDERAGDVLTRALSDAEPAVRIAALREAASRSPDVALERIAAALESETIAERQAAVEAAAMMNSAGATDVLRDLSQKLTAGDVPAELRLDVYLAARQSSDNEIAAIVTAYEGTRDEEDPLSAFAETLHGGDAARGEEIFFNRLEFSCQRCHTVDSRGGAIGPELSKIAEKRDRRYLLESLVDPNKQIAENFETVVVETSDGRILSGVFKDETDGLLRLQTPEGQILEIALDQIEVRERGQSAMPNDLTEKMSPREIRDLVEFLSTRK